MLACFPTGAHPPAAPDRPDNAVEAVEAVGAVGALDALGVMLALHMLHPAPGALGALLVGCRWYRFSVYRFAGLQSYILADALFALGLPEGVTIL